MSNVNENELHTAYETHTGGVGSLDKAWLLEVNFLGFSKYDINAKVRCKLEI